METRTERPASRQSTGAGKGAEGGTPETAHWLEEADVAPLVSGGEQQLGRGGVKGDREDALGHRLRDVALGDAQGSVGLVARLPIRPNPCLFAVRERERRRRLGEAAGCRVLARHDGLLGLLLLAVVARRRLALASHPPPALTQRVPERHLAELAPQPRRGLRATVGLPGQPRRHVTRARSKCGQ